jgi:hypothetical protein
MNFFAVSSGIVNRPEATRHPDEPKALDFVDRVIHDIEYVPVHPARLGSIASLWPSADYFWSSPENYFWSSPERRHLTCNPSRKQQAA